MANINFQKISKFGLWEFTIIFLLRNVNKFLFILICDIFTNVTPFLLYFKTTWISVDFYALVLGKLFLAKILIF